MKKIIVFVSVLVFLAGISGCRSGPQVYVPPTVVPAHYKSVFIDLVYDPVMLITYEEKTALIRDLQDRIHAMGFDISQFQDRADMTLKITIDELSLAPRNERLLSRSTFGLVKEKAYMDYTASFLDNRTYDEIVSKKGRLETSKFFPSAEEMKIKFLSEMEDEILKFMSETTVF